MTLISKLWKKLRNPTYRHGFTVAQVKQGISFQVKALRKQQDLTQAELAERANIHQSSVSRYEDCEYGDFSINVLLAIAEASDVGLICEFVPFSEVVDRHKRSPQRFVHVATFKEEDSGSSSSQEVGEIDEMDVRLPPQHARRVQVQAGSTFGNPAKLRAV